VIGRRVGNYRVEKVLGSGGMGSVYLVRHERLPNTFAALKVMHQNEPAVAQRFVQEALVAAAIGSHRVARPLDVGIFDHGEPYILMEYVEGRTLADKLANDGPLPIPQALAVAYRVADTMALAHARGIIHRDLKPSNIMLVGADEARVKLLDFGVARASGEIKVAVTREAAIIGTPGYLSPEAAMGGAVDGKSDVFSLGVVLFKMISGELPFPAAVSRESMASLLSEPAPALSSRTPRPVAPLVESCVAEALAKDPATRPTMPQLRDRLGEMLSSMGELPSMLNEAAAPIAAPPMDGLASTLTEAGSESDLERVRERVERFAASRMRSDSGRRRTTVIAAFATLLVIALATVPFVTRRSSAPAPALNQRQVTFRGDALNLGISPDGKTLAYVANDHLYFVELDSQREREAGSASYAGLPRWLPDSSAIEVNHTDAEEAQRIRREGGSTERISRHVTSAFGPSGERVAEAKRWWKFVEIRRNDQVERTLNVAGDYLFLAVTDWSPDGKRLLVVTTSSTSNQIWSLSVDGAAQLKLAEVASSAVLQALFTADGRGAIYFSESPRGGVDLKFVSVKGESTPFTVAEALPTTQASYFSLSRDGHRFTYTRARGANELWAGDISDPDAPAATTRWRRILEDSAEKDRPHLSPDGRQVAYVSPDGASYNMFVAPFEGGIPRRIGLAARSTGSPAAWSPDGKQLVFIDGQKSARVIRVVGVDSSDSQMFSADGISGDRPELVWAPAPFISALAEGNRNYALIDPMTGARKPLLADDSSGWVLGLAWNRDGHTAAIHWYRKPDVPLAGLGLWTVSLDGSLRHVENGPFIPVSWSSDGRWIYSVRSERTRRREIRRTEIATGIGRTWLTTPLDKPVTWCDLSQDSRRVACTAGAQSDVWVIEDFDKLLPN
jgi:Tol biopolymer transport system component/predicted Ser/Thr protein kinase